MKIRTYTNNLKEHLHPTANEWAGNELNLVIKKKYRNLNPWKKDVMWQEYERVRRSICLNRQFEPSLMIRVHRELRNRITFG